MKSIEWIKSEHDELLRAAADERASSIHRLKQRIHRVLRDQATRRKVFAAIDAWAEAEKRKTR